MNKYSITIITCLLILNILLLIKLGKNKSEKYHIDLNEQFNKELIQSRQNIVFEFFNDSVSFEVDTNRLFRNPNWEIVSLNKFPNKKYLIILPQNSCTPCFINELVLENKVNGFVNFNEILIIRCVSNKVEFDNSKNDFVDLYTDNPFIKEIDKSCMPYIISISENKINNIHLIDINNKNNILNTLKYLNKANNSFFSYN